MKRNYLKNSWRIYKKNFSRIYSFTLSVIILLLAAFTFILILSPFDFGLIGILILAFGAVPLFFCLQHMIARVSAGKIVEYNEFYRPYKAYFTPVNRGTYSIISSVLFSFIVFYLSIYLSLLAYDIFHYGTLNEIMKGVDLFNSNLTYQQALDLVNKILNLPHYIYFLVASMVLPFIFFFNRIKNRLMIAYFNLIVPLPNMMLQSINKNVIRQNKKEIKDACFSGNFIFIISFTLGFFAFGIVGILLDDLLPSISYIFIIALCGGLLISSFFLPPVIINYCFMADKLHASFLGNVKKQMVLLSSKIEEEDPDDSEIIKKMLDNLTSNTKKKENEENEKNSD